MLNLLVDTGGYDLLNCHSGSIRLATRVDGELAVFELLRKSFAVEKPIMRHR